MKVIMDREGKYRLVLRDKKEKHMQIPQTLIVAKPGFGKSLAMEGLMWKFYQNGFTIIDLCDSKDLMETGFCAFEPEREYHLKKLEYEGGKKKSLNIKIHHPFTFKIPKKEIPETEFFTIPIKDLTENEINFMLESVEDKVNREILLNVIRGLTPSEGLWNFLYKLRKKTKKLEKGQREMKDDLFDVSVGTIRSYKEFINIFDRFRTHLFLSEARSKMNIKMKKALKQHKFIHIFTTRYIKDQKTKDFVRLYLLRKIVEYAEETKTPVLIIFEEMASLCPSQSKGYKRILSSFIRKCLITDFRARGISSVSTTQTFAGIDKKITGSNAFSLLLLGAIMGDTDLDALRQIYGYSKDAVQRIERLGMGEFFIEGIPNVNLELNDPYITLIPPFCHSEPDYDFNTMFRKYYPNQMKDYEGLIEEQKQVRQNQIDWAKRQLAKEPKTKEEKAQESKELAEEVVDEADDSEDIEEMEEEDGIE